jgi:hypothetical protein
MLPNMHPRTIMHAKIFVFMPPFNSQKQPDCKLLLGRRLGAIEASFRVDLLIIPNDTKLRLELIKNAFPLSKAPSFGPINLRSHSHPCIAEPATVATVSFRLAIEFSTAR